MAYLGIFLILLAGWTSYAAFYGVNPAKTGLQILQDPNSAEKILTAARLDAQGELQTALTANRVAGTPATAGTAGAGVSAATGDGGSVVAFARAQIGKRYVLGGSGPDVWDCSGLVQQAYKRVGITVTHSALAQSLKGVRITRKADLMPGDLLFPTGLGVAAIGDHVQIYTGANSVVEAANPEAGVREVPLSHWWKTDAVVARRYITSASSKSAGTSKTAGSYYGG